MSVFKKLLFWSLTIIILLIISGFVFVKFSPVFGGAPDEQTKSRMLASDNFKNDSFVNRHPVSDDPDSPKPPMLDWLKSVLFPPQGKHPESPLPTKTPNYVHQSEPTFTWYGHSTILIDTGKLRLLTDPVFYRASPVWPVGSPYAFDHAFTIESMPNIDAVLISHDHYDHLDARAIAELDEKVGHFYVPLGVRAHLLRWGISDEKITELDWFEETDFGGNTLVFTPSKHFSGRKPGVRNDTLWGSWVINTPELNAFFSGDGGYNPDFKMIGEEYGPFDIAFMEDGAYSPYWPEIHMLPEESVQAALDVKARNVMPIHWGKFDLAFHNWNEPVIRFRQAATSTDLNVATPYIGQTFKLDAPPSERWW